MSICLLKRHQALCLCRVPTTSSRTTVLKHTQGSLERPFNQLPAHISVYRGYSSASGTRTPAPLEHSAQTLRKDVSGPVKSLTWEDYFNYRKSLVRQKVTLTSLGTSISFLGSTIFVLNYRFSLTDTVFGIDLYYLMPLFVASVTSLGYLLSPALGEVTWRFVNRGIIAALDKKDKDFYARIKKYRAQPGFGRLGAPPDYYGERIGSRLDYRRWLRKQRKYEKGIGVSKLAI